jgi:bifunctional non-homologous end joining protein LigD
MDSLVKIETREIQLTNLEKVYWPEDGYTKYDLIRYYTDISPYLLKYLQGRPVNFQRFPDGIHGKSFYQKNCPDHAPAWIKTFPIASEREGKVTNYMLVEDAPTLAWLANLGCLEIHPWLSSIPNLDCPDYAVFDLDPPGFHFFPQVLEVALLVKEALDSLGLTAYPKTSGSSGLQIFVPLAARFTYEEVRLFTGTVCAVIEKFDKRTTTERRVEARGERIYLDYLQNVQGKTINAPYSVRPLPGAPVSTPLLWEEVAKGRLSPRQFTMKNIFRRLEEKGDIFTGRPGEEQDIGPFLEELQAKAAAGS